MEDKKEEIETITEVKNETNIQEKKEPDGEPISGLVAKEKVDQLLEMGFSKNVAEKALFLNDQTIDKAMEWIYEHQEEPDFEEELRIVAQEK